MKRALVVGLTVVALFFGREAACGTACDAGASKPEAVLAAAQTALRTRDALDAVDAPVALVARVGTDLSKHGLTYSHVGFALRDHPAGRWTVVHLLNACGTDRSDLYADGLVNFFADDLVNQDARIVWLEPALAARVADTLQGAAPRRLHEPHYSVIARPGSTRYQNSTAWVLEVLAAARVPRAIASRNDVHAQGHVPDTVHIPYGQRVLGGLFGANVAFTDHPLGTRLSGEYPVVTVRSILRWLETVDAIAAQREWRDGIERTAPGPA